MILIVCLHCHSALRVTGEPEEVHQLVGAESEFWPDKYPCSSCTNMAKGLLEVQADPTALAQLRVTDVNPAEAFASFHGLGLPEERNCDVATVEALLREHPVRRVRGTTVNNRTVLEHLELWDGTRMYFGASSHGAVVFRITRPHSYVDKVLSL